MIPSRSGSRQLFHVEIRSRKQAAFFGNGQHRHRAILTIGNQVGPFTGINSNIDFNQLLWIAILLGIFIIANANLFTDVQHRGVITLPFPDHNAATHVDAIHPLPHGFHSNLVSGVFFTLTHPTCRGDRGLFHNFNNLETEGAIHGRVPPNCLPTLQLRPDPKCRSMSDVQFSSLSKCGSPAGALGNESV